MGMSGVVAGTRDVGENGVVVLDVEYEGGLEVVDVTATEGEVNGAPKGGVTA